MKTLALFLGVLASLSSLESQAEMLIGTARNGKGEIVYLERHEIKRDGDGLTQLIRVEYLRPGSEVFATMVSDFSKNKMVPDTVFEDRRFRSKNVLRVSESVVEFEEIENGQVTSKSTVPVEEFMVAGQGFDNFIRANSSKLAQGPQKFQFGVLSEQDFFSLTGFKKESSSPEEVAFGIKASSWFIRLFAKELSVTYDAKSMRLKTFAGRSNILSDDGSSQDVVISYQWKDS